MNDKQHRLNRSTKQLLNSGKFKGYSFRKIRIMLKASAKMLRKRFCKETRY